MQINKDDLETIYTADALYDGPEGQLCAGDKFRVVESNDIDDDLIMIRLIDDNYIMTIRHKGGVIVSD